MPSDAPDRVLLEELARFAGELARRMGRAAHAIQGELSQIEVKPDTTIVTEADRQAEHIATEALRRECPADGILSEECGYVAGSSGRVWVIDPVDGTTNYARGLPLYAVSVALFEAGAPLVGATYAPAQDELCTAARGLGAWHNDERLRCPRLDLTPESLFALGSIYRQESPPDYLWRVLKRAKMRNTGSAVLNLVYVALGRFDCCITPAIKLWDAAAATLVCAEAGCWTATPEGEPLYPLADPVEAYLGREFPVAAAGPGVAAQIRKGILGHSC